MPDMPLDAKWHTISELFPPFAAMREMEALWQALQKAWPLAGKHRQSLGGDIFELSRLLTCERGDLRGPYWQRPAFVSAYLYYFLPWNILRLCRLFSALPLSDPRRLERPLLMDIGSGPLSVPLALWIAKPELRQAPIKVLAMDAASQPLRLGADIFRNLAEILHYPAWDIEIIKAPLHAAGRLCPQDQNFWLLTAANVLNELKIKKRHASEDEEADTLQGRLGDLLESWRPLWQRENTQMLFAEPGTRLGGKTIMALREAALENGLEPISPCVHNNPCPLLDKKDSWCHFVFAAGKIPAWLEKVSREADLAKTSLSLSPLLLGSKREAPDMPAFPCRVISQKFPVQGRICRYGCAYCGLCLLPDSAALVSGSLTCASPSGEKDHKSDAAIIKPFIPGPVLTNRKSSHNSKSRKNKENS